MMSSGIIDQWMATKGWRAGAAHMRNLRTAFDTADADGNGSIDFEEFAAVISALHHTGAAKRACDSNGLLPWACA
eukprot:SAG11_NODE_7491_length_1137_cov_1.502890_1_plen_74_part_10